MHRVPSAQVIYVWIENHYSFKTRKEVNYQNVYA